MGSIAEARSAALRVARWLVSKDQKDDAVALLVAWATQGPHDPDAEMLLHEAKTLQPGSSLLRLAQEKLSGAFDRHPALESAMARFSPEELDRLGREAARLSFQRAQMGFNNNVRYQGAAYHLQTEDSGPDRAHVITHLFADGGRVIKSTKRSYQGELQRADIGEYVKGLMKAQHFEMALALREGTLDEVIAGRARGGLDVRDDFPRASARTPEPPMTAGSGSLPNASIAYSPVPSQVATAAIAAGPPPGSEPQRDLHDTATPAPGPSAPVSGAGESSGPLAADAMSRMEAPTPTVSLEVLRSTHNESPDSFSAQGQTFTIGGQGDVAVVDPFCAALEGSLTWHEGDLTLTPSIDGHGIFRRVYMPCPLRPGDEFLVGDQLLRIAQQEQPPASHGPAATYRYASPRTVSAFKVVQVLEGGAEGAVSVARGTTLTMGSDHTDLCFPYDPLVSELHCRLNEHGSTIVLHDLDSRTGVFVRIRGSVVLRDEDELALGRTRLRLRLRDPS